MDEPLRILCKPKHDEKLPDGFVRAGWRKVRKGGIVRFQGQNRRSERLLPYVGAFVFCQIEEMWGLDVSIHPEGFSYEAYRDHMRGKPTKVIVPENI